MAELIYSLLEMISMIFIYQSHKNMNVFFNFWNLYNSSDI